MKAFIPLAVAPEAWECSRAFFLLFSVTEGSQVLRAAKPLHAESCRFSCSLPAPLHAACTNTLPQFLSVLFGDQH